MKFDLIGRNLKINPNSWTVSIDLEFLDPDILSMLEETEKNQGTTIKFSLSTIDKKSSTYEQQRYWYWAISEILKEKKLPTSPANIRTYDEKMRRSIFPVKWVDLGEPRLEPDVARMKDLSVDQLSECITKLKDRHKTVNWELLEYQYHQ